MKEPCPKCRERGEDNAGDNLHRYPDGGAYCHKCGYSEKAGGYKPVPKSRLTTSQVATYPFGTCKTRGISAKVAEAYGVRYAANGETGEPETVFYPFYDEAGTTITGYKVRKLPKDFSPSVGTIGKHFFGANLKKHDRLMLTEGEEDALAARTMLGTASIDVMSTPNGAKGLKSIYKHAEWLATYKEIFICFDFDKDGREGAAEHGDWLAGLVSKVKIMELNPDYGKDASDYLKSGHPDKFRLAVKEAEVYEPEGIVNGTDISIASLREPLPEGAVIPFEGLQEKLHGLRKAEILTVCAGSGIGKSTLVRECTHSLIEQGYSVANVALEDQMEVAANALIALDMNIPLPKFRMSPPSEEDMKPHYDKMVANGNTYFYKHFAGINSDSLMNKLNYYAKTKAVDYIVLDHLSLVISASESQNERKDIDTLMTNLAKLVVETGVGLIQIVHLKRTGGDKSFAKGGEVELTDLRGSAAIEQLSWSVVGLERDQQGDDRDFSRIRVLKNRTWGFTGLCDTVKFDPSTGRMSSYVKPVEEEIDEHEIESLVEGAST